ncbi:hypothetical protein [Nocardia amikacinitolerans]|uniref:hypothetical protein n=1 Tax=Nocardia amikacinitolerans TaxID=756689 RepID=UPI0020A5DF5C|nr:hypothetical protein [Nocardia amikacinitolerans]MCP2278684.1 hypothetical protein [Nocardia amikacinitolerans]
MTVADDRQSLLDTSRYLREKTIEVGDLPAKVSESCGHLVKLVRANGYGGVLTGNLVGALTAEDTVDSIWAERDKANTAINETWEKLKKLEPDLDVPVKFIDVANEWRNLRNNLIAASGDFTDTKLSEWSGDAATRYEEMRTTRQQPALDNLPLEFDKIATSLETIAASELTLYGEIATKVQELISKVEDGFFNGVKALLSISFSGALTLVQELVKVVEAARTFIIGLVKSLGDAAKTNIVEGNKISESVGVQKGLPDNKWPSGVKSSYGNGIEGIREAIGDASTKDGDKSDWTVPQ